MSLMSSPVSLLVVSGSEDLATMRGRGAGMAFGGRRTYVHVAYAPPSMAASPPERHAGPAPSQPAAPRPVEAAAPQAGRAALRACGVGTSRTGCSRRRATRTY